MDLNNYRMLGDMFAKAKACLLFRSGGFSQGLLMRRLLLWWLKVVARGVMKGKGKDVG